MMRLGSAVLEDRFARPRFVVPLVPQYLREQRVPVAVLDGEDSPSAVGGE